MTQTHITCKTAKALKEFLGDSAPLPMTRMYWAKLEANPGLFEKSLEHLGVESFPAYQLHDLLSAPFCKTMCFALALLEEKIRHKKHGTAIVRWWEFLYDELAIANRRGGLPAVEEALCKMMEGK